MCRCARDIELSAFLSFSVRFGYRWGRPEFLRAWRRAPELFVVCVEGSRLVGTCWGEPRRAGSVYLQHLAIAPRFRHRALGRRLLRSWERRARRYGAKRITLAAALRPRDVSGFYLGQGYRPYRRRADHVLMVKGRGSGPAAA